MAKVLLGLCPIGKFVFSHSDAIKHKKLIQQKLTGMGVDYVDLDGLLPERDGLVCDQGDVDAVVAYFKEKGVDAIFMPHCNFGTEGAVGMIARKMGLPALLWGPRDEAPDPVDGSRLRDTLCGLLASTKVVRKLVGNKFTYIENCRIDDPVFADSLDTFLRAAAVVKAARNMRIGYIGSRIDFFWTTITNESELLERFGIEVLPLDIAIFIENTLKRYNDNRERYSRELDALKESWLDCGNVSDTDELLKGLAAKDEMLHLVKKHRLSAVTMQSFFSIGNAIGCGTSLYTMLAGEEVLIADESDVHGAISSILIEAAKSDPGRVFFPEYVIRHPENPNAVLMWHVGAPASLRHPSCGKVTIMPPWILPGTEPVQAQFRLKDGDLSICRFDGDTGGYVLGVGEARTIEGPYTRDFYAWIEVNDWPRWERQLMEGPYIHHCSAAYGHCTDALIEAAKYLDLPVEIYGQ